MSFPAAKVTPEKQGSVQTLSKASWEEEQNFRHSSMKRLRYLWRMLVGTLAPNSVGITGLCKVVLWR